MRTKLLGFVAFATLLAASLFAFSGSTYAAPNRMPDPNNFSQDVNVVVASYNGSSYLLDARISTVRMFVKSRTGTVRVYHGNHCSDGAYDTYNSGSTSTQFQMYKTDANENRVASTAVVGGTGLFGAYGSWQLNCGWASIAYDLGTAPESNLHPGYYVVEFQSIIVDNLGVGGWNAFKLEVNSDEYISYFQNSGDKFALKAAGTGIPGSVGNYELPFAPDCNWARGNPGGGWVGLYWFDPDAGQANQNYENPIRTVVREYNRETGAYIGEQVVNVNQGNYQSGNTNIFINPNSKYVWTWEHIWSANGIQFQLPFDSANYYFGCNNDPEGWVDTASCTTITGWARDPDSLNRAINVKVYIDALPRFGGRLIGTFPANVSREPAVGVHGFSINISSYRDAYRHNIFVNAVDAQTGDEVPLQGSPKAISGAPCAPPDCSVAASPSPAATGTKFNMTLSYTYSPGTNGLRIGPLGLARAIYPGSPSEAIPERHTFPLSLAGNSHVFDGSDGTAPDGEYRYGIPGTYSLSARIRYSYAPLNQEYDQTCGNDLDIAAQPYFKIWANDTQVGGSFRDSSDGTCSVNEDQATIIGYGGDGMTNRFTGASAQYGVSSLGEIRNFFSAALRSPRTSTKSAWPVPPHGLTFANSQVAGVPFGSVDPADSNKVANYGGRGEMPSCAQDWFTTMPDGLTPVSTTNMDVDTVSGAVHNTATGRVSIAGGSVGSSKSIFLPNASDVVITGNITAANGASLYIITNGNIKVRSSVRNIDAALITTKTLYTCTDSEGGLLADKQLYDWCGGLAADGLSGKLTIRGAVIANEIKLQRTYGTLSSSVENESYSNGGAGNNAAAEEFIFDPTLYSNDPALKQPPRAKTQIDFITSLPPIL